MDELGPAVTDYRLRLGHRISQSVDKIRTKSDAAAAANVTVEQLNKWMKGSVKVPAEGLKAIAELADVDFSWLVTGGSQTIQTESRGDRSPSTGSPTDLEQPSMVSIPRYDEVRPSAGHGSVAINEVLTTRVAFERHWLVDIGVQPDAAVILPAQGDSMSPTIPDGAPMLVDTSKTEVRSGYIYVIAVGDDLLVKRVKRRLDGLFDLISDNTAYKTETVEASRLTQLRVIGRVYAAVAKF